MTSEKKVKQLYPEAWLRSIAGGYRTTGYAVSVVPQSIAAHQSPVKFLPDHGPRTGFIRKATAWKYAAEGIQAAKKGTKNGR